MLIHQRAYILGLKTVNLTYERRKQIDQRIVRHEFEQLRSHLALAAWVTRHSRPESVFQVAMGLQRQNEATVQDVLEFNSMVMGMKKEPDLKIRIPPL